jgi:HAD superfamily hydrolase (TIGR01509 family)
MLKNKKAVIFDLDGTLVDSMWMWKDIDIEYLGKHGIDLPSDLQSKVEGMSFSETAIYFKSRFNIPDSIDEIKNEWNNMARDKYSNSVPLKEGVKEFLEYLKERNILAGIATSNSRELAELALTNLGIKDYFASVRTSCEVEKGKPSPDIYLLVANDLGVLPEECLVFEDVIHGIMAGKNANMTVCAVDDDFSKGVTDKKIEISDYFINNYFELI